MPESRATTRPAERVPLGFGDELAIEVLVGAKSALVRLRGELDLAGRARLHSALARCGERDVAVDLADLTFLDCSGYTALDDAARELAARGRHLHLVGARGHVAKVLDLLRRLPSTTHPTAAQGTDMRTQAAVRSGAPSNRLGRRHVSR
jgi:anti-anti-sigma factor